MSVWGWAGDFRLAPVGLSLLMMSSGREADGS